MATYWVVERPAGSRGPSGIGLPQINYMRLGRMHANACAVGWTTDIQDATRFESKASADHVRFTSTIDHPACDELVTEHEDV